MKILVINGSPKTKKMSITMRHIELLQVAFSDHEFEDIPVSLKIKQIEKEESYFSEIINKVRQADLILWTYPVYFYSIPGQLKRFIELIIQKKQTDAFNGKYTSSISTSGGIYDYPAHEYMHAISEDFGMRYSPGCSLKSLYFKDLMDKQKRESFLAYFSHLLDVVKEKSPLVKKYPKMNFVQKEIPQLEPTPANTKPNGKKLLIITDQKPGTNLEKMIDYASKSSNFSIETVNINNISVKNGCIGCVQCQFYGRCMINDDVNELFGKKVLSSDAVLYAMTMHDRHISAQWKMLLDRTLFIAKKNVYKNIHSAFIISGPALASCFINEFIGIYSSSRCLHNAGYVSDETGDPETIRTNLTSLMSELEHNVLENIKRPYMYYKRAYFYAMKDLMYIYGLNSHTAKYYRKNKLFDYPQKTLKYTMMRSMLNFMFSFPLTKKHFRKNINLISAEQYGRVVESFSASKDKR